MILRELRLIAWGPFAGVTLDLARPGVQLVYGRNEAGKSTTLRAIRALLYGVPRATSDAHRHAMKDLRVGAVLEARDGTRLEVVRRKGNANTVLDADGAPMDDARLARMLGGVSEDLFASMFGLDHVSLRRGADALLQGKGDLGESLFDAGVGTGAHAVLEGLRAEADAIFTPHARSRPLAEALRALTEAQKRSREGALSADAWSAQVAGLEQARAERATCDEARGRLASELGRLRGAVDATREREQASVAVSALTREIEDLEARRAALSVPDALASADEAMEALTSRLATHRAAMQELPRLRAQAENLEATTATIRARLGDAERAPRAAMTVGAIARVQKLALEPAALEEKLAAAERALARAESELGAQRAAVEGAPGDDRDAPRVSALATAVAHAQAEGQIDARVEAKSEEVARLEEDARRKLEALAMGSGPTTIEAARALLVPAVESVERAAGEWEALRARRGRIEERAEEVAARAREVAHEIEALERVAKVPTEEDLARAREERDAAWSRIRADWAGGAAHAPEYERLGADADAIADRLRREAERVSRLARLLADRGACERAVAENVEETAALDARVDEARGAWRRLWAPCGLEPQSPAEMRGWLGRHGALVDVVDRGIRARRELGVLAARASEVRQELAAVITAMGEPVHAASNIAALATCAARTLRAAEESARDRRDAERAVKRLERDRRRLEADATNARAATASWRGAWADAVAPLGLGREASPAEALAMLDERRTLEQRLEELSAVIARRDAIEAEAEEFVAETRRLAREHAPQLAAVDPQSTAEQLVALHRRARDHQVERRAIEQSLAEKRAAVAAHAHRVTLACTRIAVLFPDEPSLDAGVLSTRIEQVEVDLAELVDQRSRIDQDIGGKQLGLDSINKGESVAADAAAEAQEHLARVRLLADRYVRTRLAAVVLARELERYRATHQGPVLKRGSELFARLTLGSFAGLRAGHDEGDETVLRCVRTDGGEVPVEGLSDGTRDQLYLALRVASLERHAGAGEPLPFVVDDILIHSDDERAEAALRVLHELSARTQVLFFTHHARLVDLARGAIPPDGLRVHTLGDPTASPGSEVTAARAGGP